jgi:BirA family transcriptional regulator, biotin operon repressor / biotin---[acetyl-CoA-carboxylase] ligase
MGAEPGSVFWNDAQGRCRAVFVFAPDRPLAAGLVLDLGALALFDAIAALAPPQIPVHLLPPDGLAVDGGRVATLRMAEAPAAIGAIPDWAVLGLDVAVNTGAAAPGETPDQTCLAEEGFGDVTSADLLVHMSRHLLGWLDLWREDGAAALARAVAQRASLETVVA